mgnify:CR=1 FL=1
MSNLMRELFFADAFYFKDIENSNDMNKKLVKNIKYFKNRIKITCPGEITNE